MNGFSKPHLVRKKPCCALAGIFQKPESPFHLIRSQAFAKGAERTRIEVGSGCGRLPRPVGNARFDVASLGFPKLVGTALLRGIAVPENLLQITRQLGIRHGQASIGEPKLGFSTLQKALQILGTENSLLACGEVDMEIQPAVTPLLQREAWLEADDILGDMLKTLAFPDAPFLFESGEIGGEKFDDGILAAQDGFSFVVFESTPYELRQCGGFGHGILNSLLRVMKRNRPFEMAQRAFDGELHARALGCHRLWRRGFHDRGGLCRTLRSRGDDFERGGDGMGADHSALSRIPAWTEILDIHWILDFQACRKFLPSLADSPLQHGRLVAGFADSSRVADGFCLFENRPTAERDEEFFCDFHVGQGSW